MRQQQDRTKKKDAERDMPFAGGTKDDRDLTTSEIEDRAPYYVLRYLAGASITHSLDGLSVHIRMGGNEFIVTREAHRYFERIAQGIGDVLRERGIVRPYDVEAVNRIHAMARKSAHDEGRCEPERLRVLFLRRDSGGCGFYRVLQPVKWMNDTCPWLHVEHSEWFSFPLGCRYDVIVAPRVGDASTMGILMHLQRVGKTVVYEADDLLDEIPEWNPAHYAMRPDEDRMREAFRLKVDALIVSTEELAIALKRENVTHVCHNGIDPTLWPMRAAPPPRDGGPVRILWGGSPTHEKDLELVVPAVEKILRKERACTFVWVGYAPPSFTCGYNEGGKIRSGIAPEYSSRMEYHPGSGDPITWSGYLSRLAPNIAIAPLTQHRFNEAKSELKALEAWALGVPIIASDIAPYRRAISHNENGVLARTVDEWEAALLRLIRDIRERERLASAGLKRLTDSYCMSTMVREYERAIIRIARGRVKRAECAANLERLARERGVCDT